MENNAPSGRSYWDLLGAALRALDAGDLPRAERHFELALEARQQSPGRVFLTEKISDGLARLLQGKSAGKGQTGRWSRRSGEFRQRFLQEGEQVVRSAVRLAELRPEDDADANQPVLEKALYLVGRSRLFSEEPASAVPLLKGLFRTAGKTGRLFDVQLIRHDIPLTEEDRLWLARKGPGMLGEFVASGALETGSADSAVWVRTILQLLHPRYFGSTGRLEEERAWLEAVTTDRMLGRSAESVGLYRAYLKVNPEPGERSDEARIRLLELLANSEALHFPVPLYEEALGAMQSAGLASGSAAGERYQLALERMDYRRPDPDPGTAGAAWASAGLEPDGRVAVVFWWGDQPRDLAFWAAGDDPGLMVRFLGPCAGRIIATEPAVVETLGAAWEDTPAAWSVRDFATAFLEPVLGDRGVDDDTFLRIGLGESGPWRGGWNADLGQALLEPPRRSALVESWRQGQASGALLGGLVWRAVLARIERSDPSLRAGIGALARRGDPAADFLYDFLNLDQGQGQSIDASFQPWTLPLLWTRPDPFVWSPGAAPADPDSGPRPDLGHNDLAIVTTGDPGAVLTAWGDGRQKWRVVLDRLDRLAALARVAASAIGPVTLIPAGGQVHSLRAGLALLEKMLGREGRPAGQVDGLLPLFHWIRLVETHNGDLLDFRQVRPRPAAALALFDAYQELVGDLEMVDPVLEPDEEGDPWAAQFSQRVRKAGLVAGLADGLTLDPARLDSLWGVFEGSDASWVFLDSAAIHWYLLSRQGLGIQELHALLHTRGRRHLSMLVGAVWMRSELEDLLGTWLGVFGSPYCLALTNLAPPLLRLADQGVVPDAVHLAVEAHAAPVAQVAESIELAGSGAVLLPAFGSHRDLWRRVANGELGLGKRNWRFLDPGQASDTALPTQECAGATRLLLVPVLDSLSDHAMPIAQQDTPEAWARADKDRSVYLLWRRRLCGLEMASLLAGPWETVEILDCRWWRILEPETAAAGSAAAVPWSGERALALAAPGSGRLFNLPGVGPGQGRTIHPNILETVRHWHAGRAPARAAAAAAATALPAEGKILLALRDARSVWEPMLVPVARAWEQGRTDRWLLLVSRWMPEQGAAVVAAGYSPGVSVWTADRTGHRPAPVLWCTADDLDDPELKAFLRQAPPASVLALDVQDWLPSAERTGQLGAAALHTLRDLPVQRLVLQAEGLSPPWASFLARETGARLLGQAAATVAAPSAGTAGDSGPLPAAALATGGSLALPDAGLALTPEVIARRMRRLLENPAALLAAQLPDGAGETPPRGSQLTALDRLGFLAGLSADQVASCFRLLRWVARFCGDSLSTADLAAVLDLPAHRTGRPGVLGHGLLIGRRFAEIEVQLSRLEQQLPVLFPLLLGTHRPGLPTWFDLEFPPAQLPRQELEFLDGFLAACALAGGGVGGLIYACPRGALNSSRRLIGTAGDPGKVLAGLLRHLDVFRSRLREVMGSAVETGEGFLVETGLTDLREEEREFLTLGSWLGLWRWLGPVCPGALHLVDLATTAASPTVRQGVTCWDLLADELTLAAVARAGDAAPAAGREEKGPREGSRWAVGGLRAMLPGGVRCDELDEAADRVTALTHPQGESGLLVIAGLAGTGRHQALARGLQNAAEGAGVLGEITVYSPDTAAAAHFLDECRREGRGCLLPEVRIIGPGAAAPRSQRPASGPTAGSDAVIVMLEIQRFEAETRYQIAQLGRGRRLVMTTDPAAAAEPWEHLFLTVPRASEVVRLEVQRSVSRRIWSEVRQLLPEEFRGKGQSQASHKGQIEAVYAVNLDQCLARMFQEVEAGTLPQRFRLVGPLASDLEFLGVSLRERGWLAVPEKELDALLLPGPRELLAGTACLLGTAGVLARRYPVAPAPGTGDRQPLAGTAGAALQDLAGATLGPQGRRGLGPWLDRCRELDGGLTFGEFFAELETWPWARSVLADPGAAARALALRDAWTRIPLADLPEEPLWEAWWYTVTEGSPVLGAGARRPLVTLASADQHSGVAAAAGVYLCLGSELPRQHYQVLSRLGERALILYKERSPLVSGAGE